MADDLVERVVQQVMRQFASGAPAAATPPPAAGPVANPGLTEFVGTGMGDTIGIVIANLEPVLHEKMGLEQEVPLGRHIRRPHGCGTATDGRR